MISAFLEAFLCTWLIESLVFILLLKHTFPLIQIFAISLLLNISTLPFVWFAFPVIFREYTVYLIIAESFAYILEAFLLTIMIKNIPSALKTSIIVNTASLLFGLLTFL